MKHLKGIDTDFADVSCVEFTYCYCHAMCSGRRDVNINGFGFRSWA